MRIRRFTTAESPAGVRVQADDVLDSSAAGAMDVVDIWGFDKVPALPVRPEDVLGDYRRVGAFGRPAGCAPTSSSSRRRPGTSRRTSPRPWQASTSAPGEA